MAGNIQGITIEFQGNTTPLEQAMRKINSSTKSLDSELKKINTALKFNPTNVDLWKMKQQALSDRIKQTKQNLDDLKDAQAQLDDKQVDKESQEYRQLQREIITAESKLKHFEGQLKQVGNAKLKALGEQFKQVGAKIKEAGAKVTELGQNLTMKVTAPLAAVGGVAIKSFAEVDKTMQLTNATMGNTEQQAQLLNTAMKEAAANSTYGMKDAATATLNFARAGLTAEQAASTLAPAMNLAAGEGGDLDTVSAGLVATINGFHDSFDNAATYADVFTNACNNSALDVNSLSDAMSIAAPIFSAAGYSIQDAALYMGILANNGIDANKGATSLKTGLARLIDPSKQGAQTMADLGLYLADGRTAFENLDGSMKSTTEVQKILNESFSKLSESEQIAAASAIFGKNQMAPWLALINTAPADVQALNESLSQTGTTTQMADSMMSGFGGSLEKLNSSIDVAKTSFGEALAPAIQKVTDLIQKLVDWFNALDPQTQTMIATIALVVAAIGPVLVIVGTLITSIGTIISAIGTLMPVLGLLAGPFGLIVAAIAAAIAAMVWLTNNFDKVEAGAKALWATITQAFNAIKTAISNALMAALTIVTTTWNNIKARIAQTIQNIKTTVTTAFNNIKTTILNIFNSIVSVASSTWNRVKDAIAKPIQRAKEIVKSVLDKIKGFFPIKIGNLFDHIKLPHFNISWSQLGKTGLKIPHFNGINWYAQGGIFDSPTVAGIGEAGPEAVVPLDKLWSKMDKIAEGSGGMNVVINVQASPGMDTKALAQEVQRQLVNTVNRRRLAWQ